MSEPQLEGDAFPEEEIEYVVEQPHPIEMAEGYAIFADHDALREMLDRIGGLMLWLRESGLFFLESATLKWRNIEDALKASDKPKLKVIKDKP